MYQIIKTTKNNQSLISIAIKRIENKEPFVIVSATYETEGHLKVSLEEILKQLSQSFQIPHLGLRIPCEYLKQLPENFQPKLDTLIPPTASHAHIRLSIDKISEDGSRYESVFTITGYELMDF